MHTSPIGAALTRAVVAVSASVATVVLAVPGSADPQAPNPLDPSGLPNVNGLAPVSPAEYSVMADNWYAFTTPGGITCVLYRSSDGYGCSGPLPGAPGGANMVSGGGGEPTFSNTDRPVFANVTDAKPLPAGHRLSYRDISCGVDATGALTCVNSRTQHGFMVGPGGSSTA